MNYLTDILHRASAGRKLTTREAAFLQAIKGALIGFLAPLIPYFLPVIMGQAHIVWSGEALSSLIGAFIAFVLRLYFAQNDEELGNVLEAYYNAKSKAALDQMIEPGGVPMVQFAVPMAKASAAVAAAQQSTPIQQEAALPTIHDIITSPQPAIEPPRGGSVIAPVPTMSATAADRFAQRAMDVVAGAPTVSMPIAPTMPIQSVNPLTTPQQ